MNLRNSRYWGLLRGTAGGVLVSFILLGLLTGCLWEPERSNPSDPFSEFYEQDGTLVIRVIDREDSPLEGAEVKLPGFNEARYTNTNGKAVFAVPSELQYFTVSRDDYVSQSGEADVYPRATTTRTIKLNGKPSIDSVGVRTRMVEVDTDLYLYGYEFEVCAGDADGENDLTDILFYRPGDNQPTTHIASSFVLLEEDVTSSITVFYESLGLDFRFVLYDEAEDTAQYTTQINNVLHYRGLTENMIDDTELFYIGDIQLTWENLASEELDVPAPSYRARIYTSQTIKESFIDTTEYFENPEQDTLSITIYQTEGFVEGFPYWWELYMIDMFGNYVQSDRQRFVPQNIQGE